MDPMWYVVIAAFLLIAGLGAYMVWWMHTRLSMARKVLTLLWDPRTGAAKLKPLTPGRHGVSYGADKERVTAPLDQTLMATLSEGPMGTVGCKIALVDAVTGVQYALKPTDIDRDVDTIDGRYLAAAEDDTWAEALNRSKPPGLLGQLQGYLPVMVLVVLGLLLPLLGLVVYVAGKLGGWW
jgi:hypothetical protein